MYQIADEGSHSGMPSMKKNISTRRKLGNQGERLEPHYLNLQGFIYFYFILLHGGAFSHVNLNWYNQK